ncbi:MAG TPA: prolipoprotein diacylglyceryl transferase [Gemmatimonadales bacterium]|nr:prolipoprotein diacylglyceryl transferase [Gemmatimonadales bacterium]
MTTVYPFNFHVGPLNVTGYGIMLMVGFLVGGWLMDRDLRERGLHPEYAADMTVAAVIGGVLGAKLWFVAATGELSSLFSRGGLVWYGGFLGGVAVVLLNGRRLKVPMRWTMEITAPALAAAYALGRIGCFLVGDDYGVPSSLPWAVQFPQGIPPTTAGNLARDFHVAIPAGVSPETVLAVHPTQLYETLAMVGVFMVLWRLRGHRHGTGWLFGIYLMLAGTERFLVEFIRAKEDRLFGGVSLAQLTALAIVLTGAVVTARFKNAGAAAPGPYLSRPRA